MEKNNYSYRAGYSRCPKCKKSCERIAVWENKKLIGFTGGSCPMCGWQGTRKIDKAEELEKVKEGYFTNK